jgi:cobalt-zinc-cadmium efflux system outer membrane protein
MKKQIILFCILFIGSFSTAFSQDTLKLSLNEAEKRFLLENAQLIAQQYNTAQAKAEIITARLFENPELSYENLFYNHETGRFLETSKATGQYAASISQIVKLAGKRNKNIQLAQTGLKVEEYAYFDLMRTLRYELRDTYYKAYYTQLSASVYVQHVSALEQLLSASEKQLELGNIAVKDIIRMKSRYYSLKGDYTAIQHELEELKGRLKLLTHLPADKELALTGDGIDPDSFKPHEKPYRLLLDSASVHRADLQMARTAVTFSQNMLSVQKSNAVPDVAISLSYDLKGNYPEKYTGLGISIPIPLFNRNQGEIKKARIAVDASNAGLKQQEAIVETELFTSYKTAIKTEQLYRSMDHNFTGSFAELMIGVTKNFRERNISLVEFLDFYDAFNENTSQLNNLKYEMLNAKETINYHTGTSIYK